jgi:hypothetical protein
VMTRILYDFQTVRGTGGDLEGLTFPNKFQYIQLLYRRYRRLRVELKRALSIAFILMLDALPIAPKILVRIVNASP